MQPPKERETTPATDWVIFGGTGDLALRKLMPALYRSQLQAGLAQRTRIIAVSRHAISRQKLIAQVREGLGEYLTEGEFSDSEWLSFNERLIPVQLDIAEAGSDWNRLGELLTPDHAPLFYLAIPPSLFGSACEHLAAAGLITPAARVIVEKPIGYDQASAQAINDQIAHFFCEQQIYRIDHYLGKETVQNLLALRFSNGIFENLWEGRSIDHVQITLAETVGVESRGGFYDKVGALRDMVQNHLLQLLSLVAMEPPAKLNAESIRAEKIKVLSALRPITGEQLSTHTVRAQYQAGKIDGTSVDSYTDDLGGDSQTETFVAIRAHIDNWRWAGIPFYLRTGKRLQQRFAEIVIQFKPVSHWAYPSAAISGIPSAVPPGIAPATNRLVIRLQPDEGIQLALTAKDINSPAMSALKPVVLKLDFADTFVHRVSDAYKRLMIDAMAGDARLFIHRDEVTQAWRWTDPIVQGWRDSLSPLQRYKAGSWGPPAADALLAVDGRGWLAHDQGSVVKPLNLTDNQGNPYDH